MAFGLYLFRDKDWYMFVRFRSTKRESKLFKAEVGKAVEDNTSDACYELG